MYARSFILAKILQTMPNYFPMGLVDEWFEGAEVIECTEDRVVLYSSSEENLKNIREQCYSYILALVRDLLQCNASLEIWGAYELDQHKHKQEQEPDYLKPQFLFENFVVGTSNEMAVKAAKAVATNPGDEMLNPLYIYGASGVGKTHLLWAVANQIHITKPNAKICCVLADTFVGELIWSLQNGRYENFRQKYRSADVLIVEDVQFLAGRAATQEEFYKIFDYLYDGHKQLIFSANCSPSSLPGMEEYLRSKFEQGVIIHIELPDAQIRKAIITQLARKYQLNISDEAVLYITETITDSIRKITGAMKLLRAKHDIDGVELSLELIQSVLQQLG